MGHSLTVMDAHNVRIALPPSSANARHKQGHALKDALDTATPTKGSDIMTQDHVAGFASELVKMAQAVERVPQLEATIHRLEAQVANANASKADMHSELEQSRSYAASLEQRVHDLEVARDDAELRFLEVDDAKDTLVRVLDSLGKDILGALQAVAPVPAAPTEVSPKVMEAVSVDAPLVNDGPFNGMAGQSESPLSNANGIATETHDTVSSESAASQSTAASTEGVSVPTSPTSAPAPATGTGTELPSSNSEGVSVSSDPTPPADSTPASPDDASSSADTEDDLGEPEGKYSSAWYHWVDAKPGRRQRILGY